MASLSKPVSDDAGDSNPDRSRIIGRDRRYRVAQWGTGNVGTQALRATLQHPQYDLVAVRVYSDAKVGRDAGDLCNEPTTGVLATQDIEDVIAAKPDCVLYMADRVDADAICRLLEAGINVATSRMEFNYRGRIEPALRARVEAACAKGNSTLFSSGSTPGWSTEILPLALTAMMRRLDCITLTEYADSASRNSPEMLFDLLHFGADPATLDPNEPHATTISTPPSLSMTADAFNLTLDDVVCTHEYALMKEDERIPAGLVKKGTIGAMRMVITGMHGGKAVIRRVTTWFVSRNVEPAWDLRDTGWRYTVEGDAPLDVMITLPVPPDVYPSVSPMLTAHPLVNAIPFVCAAEPGIRHLAEMPPIIPNFGK